ncbi:hypothetical protein KIPB_003548 [Kipferlia bialata]|uniref:AMP-dependent synthetase/ligase domain-containing protein n=1 Tax=Kipferlia bialata TaxID=797122 RepID=A0A9K3CTV2_9EUKA|nr:hypothetical protein KIPB_003548 [Kipferlia bialata]|eukprot:g3548.t1
MSRVLPLPGPDGRIDWRPLETWPSGQGYSHVKGAPMPEWNIPDPVYGRRFARGQAIDPTQVNSVFPDQGVTLTCHDMQTQAEGIGRHDMGLYSLGTEAGQPVAVALPNTAEAATSMVGIMSSGFILVFVSPSDAVELGRRLSATHCAALIVQRQYQGRDTIAMLESMPEAEGVIKVWRENQCYRDGKEVPQLD